MALVNGSVPNLINGVSQQPASIRLPTQCELQENAFSSLSEGLIKRPPTTHITRLLASAPPDRPFFHFIDRDTNEKYIFVITDGELKAFTIGGTEVHVEMTGAGVEDYLVSTTPFSDFKALSLADTTIIVNRSITVAMDAELTDDQPHYAIVWVRAGGYKVKYTLKASNKTATYETDATDPDTIQVDHIASELVTAITAALGAGWTVTRNENVISIYNDAGTGFKCLAFDTAGNNNIKAITQIGQRFSDLPDFAQENMVVNVVGDADSRDDDYWVKFRITYNTAGPTLGVGTWVETVSPLVPFHFDTTTMPHILVRKQDDALGTVTGTAFAIYFEFSVGDWAERAVGDVTTNPDPSFVGKKIEDVFLFRNRLGFLADTSVVLSKSGDLFNFFRGTALSVLDDDPIDVEAAHPRVAKLRHAVVFNQECTIFGDRAQFILTAGDTLTPATVKLTLATEFECEEMCRPIGNGKVIFFATKSGPFSGVREYFDDQTVQSGKNATAITGHVPKYISGTAFKLTAITAPEVLVCLSDGVSNTCYVYQWYWNGQEKLQSAWSSWTFGDATAQVFAAEFIGSTLYLAIKRLGGVYLESWDVSVGQLDPDSTYLTLLDRKVSEANVSVVYNASLDQSTLTLPYNSDTSLQCVARTAEDQVAGVIYDTISAATNNLVVHGDLSDVDFYVGEPYTFRYRFSPFLLRSQSSTGGFVAVEEGRLQIRTATLTCEETGYFRVDVTPLHRDTSAYSVPSRTLNGQGTLLGGVSLADGVFKFMVASKNDQVTIDLVNSSFLPCRFVKAEWDGLYSTNTRRI